MLAFSNDNITTNYRYILPKYQPTWTVFVAGLDILGSNQNCGVVT